MAKKSTVRPTALFRRCVALFPSEHAAAMAWEIEYRTLDRILRGKGINLGTAFKLARQIKLPLTDLFTDKPE